MSRTDFPDDFPRKNKRRAFRLFCKNKMKARAKYIGDKVYHLPKKAVDFFVKHADDLKFCDCWMCKNPRKTHHGQSKYTIQERKQFESEKFQ